MTTGNFNRQTPPLETSRAVSEARVTFNYPIRREPRPWGFYAHYNSSFGDADDASSPLSSLVRATNLSLKYS